MTSPRTQSSLQRARDLHAETYQEMCREIAETRALYDQMVEQGIELDDDDRRELEELERAVANARKPGTI